MGTHRPAPRLGPVTIRSFNISAALLLLATFAGTAHADERDGPYSPLPADGAAVVAPTYDDIITMADLDGDPSIITAEEAEMIALLQQVLNVNPLTD